jgi:uncharacterized repeat protein (TIGR01451 family)
LPRKESPYRHLVILFFIAYLRGLWYYLDITATFVMRKWGYMRKNVLSSIVILFLLSIIAGGYASQQLTSTTANAANQPDQDLPPRPTVRPTDPPTATPPDPPTNTPPPIPPTDTPTSKPVDPTDTPTPDPVEPTITPTTTPTSSNNGDDDGGGSDDDGGGSDDSDDKGGGGDGGDGGGLEPDPAVVARQSLLTAKVGESVIYTFVAMNMGEGAAYDVKVVVPLPSFATLVEATTSWGTVNAIGNTTRVDIGNLYPDDRVTIQVVAKVAYHTLPGKADVTATIMAEGGDMDKTNNRATSVLWTMISSGWGMGGRGG